MNDSVNNFILLTITIIGAVFTAFWIGSIIWTYKDTRTRSRDPLASVAASLMVALLPFAGVVVYIMLRPHETLADAYERSLEEEALLQEIEEKPACPGCGRSVKNEWQVCPYCHTKLKKPCFHCGNVLELSWNICPYCATPQVGYADQTLEQGYEQSPDALPASPYEAQQPSYQPRPQQNQESGVEWVDDSASYQ